METFARAVAEASWRRLKMLLAGNIETVTTLSVTRLDIDGGASAAGGDAPPLLDALAA